ncbi:hypothetical protein [Lentzea sp. NBRC 105346]|uniref:hypothetical protein n=1 Tax=Lentzea sp. NBRC 105346 TaxID=3032205 RepID=UPI002555A6EB|nr:hypothetical protein [Lentzea sp. NBRC 105346]
MQRDDLVSLFKEKLAPLQRKWGINLSSAEFARRTVAANLKVHLETLARGEKFNSAVWISFNLTGSQALHETGLDQRRLWLQDAAPRHVRMSVSTARRYLAEAIGIIVDQLTAPDYQPVITQDATAAPADVPETPPAPKPAQKLPPTTPLPPLPQPAFIKESTPERILQAQTFPNRRAVMAGLRTRFDLDSDTPDADIDHASLAVKRYGSYGRKKQEDAAIRLAQTEAGYFGVAQVHKTVLEMYRAMAPALPLVVKISEAAERAGRFDLALSHEQHTEMLSLLRFEEESPEKYDLYNGLIDRAYLDLAMRIGPAGLITSRTQCVLNLANALRLGILNARINYLRIDDSAELLGRLTGFVDNLQRLSSSATPAVSHILRTRLYEPSEGARRDAKEMIWQHLPDEYVQYEDGSYAVDPFTGERLPILDVKYHPDVARGYWEQVDPASLPSDFPPGKDFLGRDRALRPKSD